MIWLTVYNLAPSPSQKSYIETDCGSTMATTHQLGSMLACKMLRRNKTPTRRLVPPARCLKQNHLRKRLRLRHDEVHAPVKLQFGTDRLLSSHPRRMTLGGGWCNDSEWNLQNHCTHIVRLSSYLLCTCVADVHLHFAHCLTSIWAQLYHALRAAMTFDSDGETLLAIWEPRNSMFCRSHVGAMFS